MLPGGGASELAVSAMLKQKSSSIEGIEKVNHALLCAAIVWRNVLLYAMLCCIERNHNI